MHSRSHRPIQVLHVDDEPDFVDLAASFLEREDEQLDVTTATSAEEGLQRLDDCSSDCIVSDYNMPGMDGIEFLQAVREEYPDLPFILFTGKGSEAVASDALSAGATDYLQKRSGTDQYSLLSNRICNAVSQRRSAERFRKNKKEYTAVFENAQNALILVSVVDDGFRYQQCNPRAVELIGRDRTEIVGHSPRDALGPENGRKVAGAYRKCVRQGQSVSYTVTLDLPVGSVVRECEVTPVSSDSHIEQLVVEFRDITEQRERLRELEEYETITEALRDAVYVVDDEGRFTYINDEFVDLVGYDRETVLGSEPSLIKDDDSVERAERELGRLLSSDGPETSTFEITVQPRDGDSVVCADHMGVLPYEQDQFNGSVGTLRDITEQKQRRRELQTVNRQYETLVKNFPDGAVFLVNEDLEYVRAGGGELEAVGLTPDDIEGATPRELFPEDIADETCQYYEQALAGICSTFEQEYGGERYRIQTVPVQTDDEHIDQLMAVSQNVTEYAENRRTLERQNERLEEFTSIVSHDLRNPLSVAEGKLELAQETCESDHLVRAADAIDRSQALTEDLLTLAQQNERTTEIEALDVPTVAEQSWQTTDTAHATLDVDSSNVIAADRSQLQQLFENLFRNAIDHAFTSNRTGADAAAEHGDDVTVFVGAIDDGFYVADTGPGIPESDREKVFEAGYSTAEDGTGFGLRIVEQIADAHGWDITVTESEQGGARFELTAVEHIEQ